MQVWRQFKMVPVHFQGIDGAIIAVTSISKSSVALSRNNGVS